MLTQHPRPGPFAEKTPWTISQETPTYTPLQTTPPKRQGALCPLPYVLPTCVLFDQHRNIKRPLFTGPCVCQQGRGGRSGQRGLLEGCLLQVRQWTKPQHQRLRLHDHSQLCSSSSPLHLAPFSTHHPGSFLSNQVSIILFSPKVTTPGPGSFMGLKSKFSCLDVFTGQYIPSWDPEGSCCRSTWPGSSLGPSPMGGGYLDRCA